MVSMNMTDLFLDCKQKHMMKRELHLTKLEPYTACYRLFHDFKGRINFLRLSLFGCWYYLNIFRDGMGPFNDS